MNALKICGTAALGSGGLLIIVYAVNVIGDGITSHRVADQVAGVMEIFVEGMFIWLAIKLWER
ncbi:MAG: hypothetical protein AAB581_01625 [Patescibacteria group bacterium]